MNMNGDELADFARQIRRDVIRMIRHAGSGHPGGALGAAEVFAVLYGRIMRHDPSALSDPHRDRLVLSNGHICAAWYSALARTGYLPAEELATLRRLGSRLQGHPARVRLPSLVETSSGPLGQGLPVAKGIALANRLDASTGHVYCIVGDGELHEGIVWEAIMGAAHHRVGNLTLIVSYNGLQIDGRIEDIRDVRPLGAKLAAFGWKVSEVDGHDADQLIGALSSPPGVIGMPRAVIANTVMGKGVSYMEDRAQWHGSCPSAEEAERALREIGMSRRYADFPIPAEAVA